MLVFHGSRLAFDGFRWILWLFIVPGRFLQFQVGFYVFFLQDSRLVFHGFRWVFWLFKVLVWLFMVSCWFFIFFQGSRSVFHGARSVFMVFSRFQVVKVVFYGFFMVPGLVFMIPGQGGIKCGNRGTGFLDSEGSHR